MFSAKNKSAVTPVNQAIDQQIQFDARDLNLLFNLAKQAFHQQEDAFYKVCEAYKQQHQAYLAYQQLNQNKDEEAAAYQLVLKEHHQSERNKQENFATWEKEFTKAIKGKTEPIPSIITKLQNLEKNFLAHEAYYLRDEALYKELKQGYEAKRQALQPRSDQMNSSTSSTNSNSKKRSRIEQKKNPLTTANKKSISAQTSTTTPTQAQNPARIFSSPQPSSTQTTTTPTQAGNQIRMFDSPTDLPDLVTLGVSKPNGQTDDEFPNEPRRKKPRTHSKFD